LFGIRAASGLQHEVDGAAAQWWGCIVLEAKAHQGVGPSKDDVCVFQQKTFDLCLGRRQAGVTNFHWRVLASLGPVRDALRRYCYLHGIIVADPALLPLPLLLRYANRSAADCLASPVLWRELMRLAERAVVPFEKRYVPVGDCLHFDTRWWTPTDLDDLLYVQHELTEALLERLDEAAPAFFADRAVELLAGLGSTAQPVMAV
jgi:hypothetical protein